MPPVSGPRANRSRLDLGGLLLLACLVAPAALVWGAYVDGFRHVLAARGGWESTKPTLTWGLMGAVGYTITPVTLAGDRLNLGTWHGFQEVTWREPVAPQALDLTVQLSEGGHASVLYARTEAGFSGVRLSRSAHYPSIRFRATAAGEFVTSEALEVPPLGDEPVAVGLRFEPGQARLEVGGREVAGWIEAGPLEGRVGFRGGVHDAWVDEVVVTAASGEVAIRDSFEFEGSRWATRLAAFAALMLLVLALGWGIARLRGRERLGRRALTYALALTLALLILGGPLLAADRLVLSSRHGYSTLYFKLVKLVGAYENPRHGSRQEVLSRLSRESAAARPTERHRILFIGSSQTWGSGASSEEAHIVHQLEARLDELAGGPRYEVIGAGVQGARSPLLYERYAEEWIRWEPDTVLLNLGTNDLDPAVYADHLRRFVEFGRARGVATVFALEGNAVDSNREPLGPEHEAMRAVAAAEGVPLLDLHQHLVDQHHTGWLWWDFVHLTDHGQAVAARFLASELEPLLRASTPSPPPG